MPQIKSFWTSNGVKSKVLYTSKPPEKFSPVVAFGKKKSAAQRYFATKYGKLAPI